MRKSLFRNGGWGGITLKNDSFTEFPKFFPYGSFLDLWFEELQNTSPVKSQSDPMLTRRMWPGGSSFGE